MVDEPKDPSGTSSRNTRGSNSTSAGTPIPSTSSHNNVISPEDPNATLFTHFATAAAASQALSHTSSYGPIVPQGDYSHLNPFMFHHLPFHQGSTVNTQLPPFSALDVPWTQFPQSHQASQPSSFQTAPQNADMTSHVYGLPPPSVAASTSSSGNNVFTQPHGSGSAPNTVASSPMSVGGSDQEQEAISIAEEKRRRNTAASARFRTKKKQKTVNLERSVSDLTGRAEDLEREAAELRRENGWLKEIIMLKGSRLAGINLASHIMAENQRAAESLPGSSSQNAAPRRQAANVASEESSSEEEPSEEAETVKRKDKRKGKSRRK